MNFVFDSNNIPLILGVRRREQLSEPWEHIRRRLRNAYAEKKSITLGEMIFCLEKLRLKGPFRHNNF